MTDLSKEIAEALKGYCDDTEKKINDAIAETTKTAVDKLKSESPKRSGAYAKDWAVKNAGGKTKGIMKIQGKVVYNKKHYQLTHLLEFGHLSRNGKRVKPQAHIKPIEDEMIEALIKKLEEK